MFESITGDIFLCGNCHIVSKLGLMLRNEKMHREMPLRTFRIEEETTKKLKEIAANENISLNSTVNRILKEYVNIIFPAKQYDSKLIQGQVLKTMFDLIEMERFEAVSRKTGQEIFEEFNDAELMPKNSIGFRKVLCEVYCRASNWASYHESRHGNKMIINLAHHMGSKWSVFLKNYFYWQLTQLEDLKMPDVNLICSENALTISFPNTETID